METPETLALPPLAGLFYTAPPAGPSVRAARSLASAFPSPQAGIAPLGAFAALAEPQRWALLRLLATGEDLSCTEAARRVRKRVDGIAKHLRALRAAGLVSARPGADRREERYFIPAGFRPEPGVLDYGFAILRLAEA